MRYICDVCEKIFKKDDKIIHLRPGIVTDPNGAYLGTSEILDDANTIHEQCLISFVTDEPEIQICQEATPIFATQKKKEDEIHIDRNKKEPRQINAEQAIVVLVEQMGELNQNAEQGINSILENNPEVVNTEHFIREYFKRKQATCSL